MGEEEVVFLLSQLPRWHVKTEESVAKLIRRYSFKNFQQALAFTNKVGELAEQYNHHPALVIKWGEVQVEWWTHVVKALHKNDFIMAAKTEELFES